MPPGTATNASASSAISALRSCIECATLRSVSPGWPLSWSMSACGITPIASPPAARIVSASTPISPTLPPPYTSPMPRLAIRAARARAASAYAGSLPGFDPAYTQTRRIVLAAEGIEQALEVVIVVPGADGRAQVAGAREVADDDAGLRET